MRKTTALLLAIMLIMTLAFAGCTNSVSPQDGPSDSPSDAQSPSPSAEESPSEEPSEEPTPSEEPSEEPSPSEEPTPASGGTANSTPPPDIVPVETTVESPAKIGEWVETKRYNVSIREYWTVFYRVVSIERGDAAAEAVRQYNEEDHFSYFEDIEDPDLEYCLMTYEVYFPEDFPVEDYGISSADITFGAKNPEGGGISANGRTYIGLGSMHDISESPEALMPGDTWTGKAVFTMAKGYTEYVVETYYFENDEQFNSYVEGQ